MNKFDYKNLTPFKWFVLENFPFIEADFDALTEWQLFCKLGKEINKIIDSQNVVGTQMENVTNAFIELQNYVDNYFKNLDVQEEINNKLNEMAEDGTLTLLIKKYVDPIYKEYEEKINTQITNQNANIENINSKVNSLSSGSPAGVFSTLEDLKNKNPDHNKIYIVSSDGNWYYWNSNDWVSGGVYQSTKINPDDETIVNLKKRDVSYFNAILNGNISIIKGTASRGTINANDGIFYANEDERTYASETYIPLKNNVEYIISSKGSLFNIYYYDGTKRYIKSEYKNNALNNRTVTFKNENYSYIRIGSYKETNSPTIFENDITLQEKTNFIPLINQTKGILISYTKINIDTSNNKLITGDLTYLCVGNGFFRNISNKEYNIEKQITKGGFLYYDPENDIIEDLPSKSNISIGAIWLNAKVVSLFLADYSVLLINNEKYHYSPNYSEKRLYCLGDSMTAGVGTTKTYYEYLKTMLNYYSVTNYGVSGSSITPKEGDFPEWDTAKSFLERYNTMGENGDIILVFGCVNDWVTGRKLGNKESTDRFSFYGAMKLLCNGLINKYPNKQIVFFSSPQNDYINRPASIPQDNQYYNNNDGFNRQGLKLEDYTKAMYEVCEIYGIPCKRLDNVCWYGLSGLLGNGILGSDNLHPNATGHKILAENMAHFIKNNR